MMLKMLSIGVTIALLGFTAFSSAAEPPDSDGSCPELMRVKTTNLIWKNDEKRYFHYEASHNTFADEEGMKRAPVMPVKFMGYEIRENGEFEALCAPLEFSEILFQLGSYVSESKVKVNAKWSKEWVFLSDGESLDASLNLKSEWSCVSFRPADAPSTVVIVGTHTFDPKQVKDKTKLPRWDSFAFSTSAIFDIEAGIVSELTGNLDGVRLEKDYSTKDAPSKRKIYKWDLSWKLAESIDTTDTKTLLRRVDTAISKGVDWLWGKWNKEKALWPYSRHDRGNSALILLALLMCGEEPADDRIARSFDALAKTELGDAYDVCISILAYEAKYITKAERESFLKGKNGDLVQSNRKLSKEDQAEMKRLVDWIIANQNQKNSKWNYYRGWQKLPDRYDYSVTQYALLALDAATRCGIKYNMSFVKPLLLEIIEDQAPEGPEVEVVKKYKPGKRTTKGREKDKTTYSRYGVKARGWDYERTATWNEKTGITSAGGTMTCAGVTCLLAGLDLAESLDRKMQRKLFGSSAKYKAWKIKVQESLEGGFAWMEHWFSISRNPNKGAKRWYYYYMYGVERIYMLADIRYAGTHDWYHEGAAALISCQKDNGAWGSSWGYQTAFALLFLKKGTVRSKRPVYTGPDE